MMIAAIATSTTLPLWMILVGAILGWLVAIGSLISLYFSFRNFKIAIKRFDDDRIDRLKRHSVELEEVAVRACREFTNSDEYRRRKDERIREIALDVVSREFSKRSVSFVSAEKFDERIRTIERDITLITQTMKEITVQISQMSVSISREIIAQVNAHISTRLHVMSSTTAVVNEEPERGK